MNKLKTIILGLVIVGLLTALVLYMIPWGEAKSEIVELEITDVSQKVEAESGVEINDINELEGTYTTYDVDSSTSELMFSLDAMQGTVGKFKNFSATFINGESSEILVVIDPSSVYTANSMRDESLLEEGFFEVEKYTEIRFLSTEISVNDTGYVALGKVEMLGVETELSLPFTYKGKTKNYKGLEVAIFEGAFSLDRTNFGMEHTASVGDDVSVNFVVQLEKQNE